MEPVDLRSLESDDLPLTAGALIAVQRALWQTKKIMQPTVRVTPAQRDAVLADISERCQWEPSDPKNVRWNGITVLVDALEPSLQ